MEYVSKCHGARVITHEHEELYEYTSDGKPIYQLVTEYECSQCHKPTEPIPKEDADE